MRERRTHAEYHLTDPTLSSFDVKIDALTSLTLAGRD